MERLKAIFEHVDNLEIEKIVQLMDELIGIDTVNPPGNNYEIFVKTVSPYFSELGYELNEVIVPNELVNKIPHTLEGRRVNLVASKKINHHDNWVSFYAHMDVVPAPTNGSTKWRFPPFQVGQTKTKLYGRGVADMKGAIPCLITALKIIEKFGLEPNYNIQVLLCTDEEIGIWPGVRYLEENGHVKGMVFCMDGIISPILVIGTAGALNVIVETFGRSCHSGSNYLGVNALEEMVPILNELMELKKIVELRESKDIPGIPHGGKGGHHSMSPMFNLDIIRAGEKANIVPDHCTLTINRRIIPDEKYEDVVKEIKDAVERGKQKSKALDVKTTFIYDYPALKVDKNSPAIKRMANVKKLVQNISENQIKYIGDASSTDMGFLSKYDVVFTGVGNPGSNMHGVNETVKIKDIKTFIKEIITFLCL